MGKSKQPEMKNILHSFRVLLRPLLSDSCPITMHCREKLLPDYYALPGKTVAVVHFFQDRPFLLHFQKDLTGELIEGTAYVFEFETFEVELPDDEENPNISDYMYSINVTNYRVAEDDELGLEGKPTAMMPTVEIVSK